MMDSSLTSSSSSVWVSRGRWLCLMSGVALLLATLHSLSHAHLTRVASGVEGPMGDEAAVGGGSSLLLSLPLSVYAWSALSFVLGVVGSVWWSGSMVGVLAAPTFALRSTAAVYEGGGGGQGGEFRSLNHRGRGLRRSSLSQGEGRTAEEQSTPAAAYASAR